MRLLRAYKSTFLLLANYKIHFLSIIAGTESKVNFESHRSYDVGLADFNLRLLL